MRTELVTIPTDTLPLDGAFHTPESGPIRGSVLLFHGNTMNFYTGALRFLPPYLTSLGLACLAFNRRGHDILSIRDSRAAEGGAFQLTSESIADNVTAADWMTSQGFKNPIVIGHSNGGMLAVKHVSERPDTPAMVLLSAHGGGRDSVPLSCKAGLFAVDRLEELTETAHAMVAAGRGKDLMLLPGWWWVITAKSFIDRLSEMPDVLALAPKIVAPTLYLVGDLEPPANYPAKEFSKLSSGPCEVEIVPNCDHFYRNREDAVAEIVAAYLKKTLKL